MLCIHHALLERKKGNVSCSAQDPIQLPINLNCFVFSWEWAATGTSVRLRHRVGFQLIALFIGLRKLATRLHPARMEPSSWRRTRVGLEPL